MGKPEKITEDKIHTAYTYITGKSMMELLMEKQQDAIKKEKENESTS